MTYGITHGADIITEVSIRGGGFTVLTVSIAAITVDAGFTVDHFITSDIMTAAFAATESTGAGGFTISTAS